MSASPTLSIAQCLIAWVDNNAMNLPIKLSSEKQKEIEIVEEGFLDCGAGGKFIDQNYTRMKGIKMEALFLMELQTNEEPSDIMWTWKSKYMAELEKSNYW